MGYKLLGIVVFKGAKWFLRRKYGATMAPKPVLVGGLLLVIAGIAAATRQRAGAD
jgi:hypothetical protein